MRRRALLVLSLSACHLAEPLRFPDPADAKTMVVAIDSAETAKIYDLELGFPREPLHATPTSQVAVLYFRDSPSKLGLEGLEEIFRGAPDENRRALPRPEAAFQRRLHLEATFSEMKGEELDKLRATIPIPSFDVEGCLAAHTCVRDVEAGQCREDCQVAVPMSPLPPTPACPATWLVDETPGPGGIQTCRPSMPARVNCDPALGWVQHHGQSACSHLGPTCDGHFASGLPGDAIYVDPLAAPSGDGTVLRPFTTLAAALLVAAPGATVALSEGTHVGPAAISVPGARVIGACAERTTFAATSTPALVVTGAGVALSGLSLAPAEGVPIGTLADYPSLVARADMRFQGGRSGPIAIQSGRFVASDLRVEGPGQRLMLVTADAELEVDRLSVFAAHQIGVHLFEAHLLGRGLYVEGASIGLDAVGPSTVNLVDAWLQRPEVAGISMYAGAFDAGNAYATCLMVPDNVVATIEGLTIVGSGDVQVDFADGMRLGCKSSLDLRSAYLEGLTASSIIAGPVATFEISDLVIRDASTQETHTAGINVQGGCTGRIDRAYVESSAFKALDSDDEETSLIYSDMVVNVRGDLLETMIFRDGPVELDRFWFTGAGHLSIRTDYFLTINDLKGIATKGGAQLQAAVGGDVTRVELEAVGPIDVLTLGSCDAGECESPGFRIEDLVTRGGLAGLASGVVLVSAKIDRFLLEGHTLAALRLPSEVQLDLNDGMIRGNGAVIATGANDYRLLDLLDGLVIEDNDAIRLILNP